MLAIILAGTIIASPIVISDCYKDCCTKDEDGYTCLKSCIKVCDVLEKLEDCNCCTKEKPND